ncbi:MAG TPA: 3'(2'),5'-bisphosphate nucleotidase CysQ [Pseudolabrys sp.]|nr:3'(2'),5'-bisphosphate nucleotidase CysQ [Pseudolabrys sp.]
MGIGSLTSDLEITPATAAKLLDDLTAIVARAAAVILVNPATTVARRTKDDQSPVTAADEASEAVILEECAHVLAGIPIVSEERMTRSAPPPLGRSFVLVDPLDGTREFLQGNGEFTVNLAIVTAGAPIAGIIAAPALGLLWRGIVGARAERLRLAADGTAGEASQIRTRRWPGADAVAAVSRSHYEASTDSFLQRFAVTKRESVGSSLKFCRLAEGNVDVYPRLSPTCEWDIAAGHALVLAAGGAMTTPQATPLAYGTSKFLVPGFVAWGDPTQVRKAA